MVKVLEILRSMRKGLVGCFLNILFKQNKFSLTVTVKAITWTLPRKIRNIRYGIGDFNWSKNFNNSDNTRFAGRKTLLKKFMGTTGKVSRKSQRVAGLK